MGESGDSERVGSGGRFRETKSPTRCESGLAVVFSGILPPGRIVSAHRPSSPSRPVPACAFNRRHDDEGGGTKLHGVIHRGHEMVIRTARCKRIFVTVWRVATGPRIFSDAAASGNEGSAADKLVAWLIACIRSADWPAARAQNGKAAVLRPPLPFPKSAAPRSAKFFNRPCVRR